jgi:hypothetical protein
MIQFAGRAKAAVVERELHEGFCRAFGSAPAERPRRRPPSATRCTRASAAPPSRKMFWDSAHRLERWPV